MNKITYKILSGILCITMIMLSIGCSSNYDSSEQYQDEESYTNQITNDTLYSTVLNKIYKIDVNTKEKEQIIDVGACYFYSGCSIKDDWIYCTYDKFGGSGDTWPYIYKVKTNGEDPQILTKGAYPTIYGDYIYYLKSSFEESTSDTSTFTGIYRMSLSGDDDTCIKEIPASSSEYFVICNSKIYYTENAGSESTNINCVDLDGSNSETVASLSENFLRNLKSDGYYVYASGDNIYQIDPNTNETYEIISNADLEDVSNDYIYYTTYNNGSNLYKMNLNNLDENTLIYTEDTIGGVEVFGDEYLIMSCYTRQYNTKNNAYVYMCTTDGDEGTVLEEFFGL